MTSKPANLRDTAEALHRLCTQARGLRDAGRRLPEKLAASPEWRDLTGEAQQRRLVEARENLLAELRPHVERARELAAGAIHGAEERLSSARYFREARFSDDPTLEQLTRIRLALELPKTADATLGAMALDAAQRGGDEAAALLTAIRREVAARPNPPLQLKVDVASAEMRFPLPEALHDERDAVAEIARTHEAIESALHEVAQTGPRDVSDRIEHYAGGGAPPSFSLPIGEAAAADPTPAA